jgi:hypothetical protein
MDFPADNCTSKASTIMKTLGDTPLCSLQQQQEAEGKFDYDFASLVGNRKRNFLFRTTLAEISAN